MIKISNLRVGIDNKQDLKNLAARKLGIKATCVADLQIVKKSIDARKRNNICLVYVLAIKANDEAQILAKCVHDKDITLLNTAEPRAIAYGHKPLEQRIIVVGAGPAGLFAAYLLAQHGYRPLLIERGQPVQERSLAVERFWSDGVLDANSNVQFGEGGAGTFSDGKLTTRISDPVMYDIMKILVDCGAPPEILYKHKPHVGTDVLKCVVSNLSDKIRSLGGEILFNTCLQDIMLADGQVSSVVLSNDEQLDCSCLIVAIGHSARDTYAMLHNKGVQMINKPLAIGVRIEHTQQFINKMQYGQLADSPLLDVADYAVTFQDHEQIRGAYSFCMCPGGMVVASSSVPECVVTNGMSLYKRDNHLANSALVVTVDERDFGNEPLAAMELQERFERAAFVAGGRDYYAPAQSVRSFLQGGEADLQASFTSSYRPGVRPYALDKVLPPIVTQTLRKALLQFEKRMSGFTQDALLIGVETRTSAPVRIVRDTDSRQSVNVCGLYPTGEGAGYAGGIMSAAADGYHTAMQIMQEYKRV